MADYCTTADVTKVVANISTWAQGLSDKITEATTEINKILRNSLGLTTDEITGLNSQTKTDLKMAAVYWTLFLCYNDASEGAAGGYADKAVDYKRWFEKEMAIINIKTDSAPSDDDSTVETTYANSGSITL